MWQQTLCFPPPCLCPLCLPVGNLIFGNFFTFKPLMRPFNRCILILDLLFPRNRIFLTFRRPPPKILRPNFISFLPKPPKPCSEPTNNTVNPQLFCNNHFDYFILNTFHCPSKDLMNCNCNFLQSSLKVWWQSTKVLNNCMAFVDADKRNILKEMCEYI